MRPELLLAAALAAALPGARAQELAAGPGSALTAEKCQLCHELAHVTRARLSREAWADMVKLMRERGAPLTEAEAETIAAYLATYYGTAPPPASGAGTPASARK